jgi:predicted TIM-barrel fold metal-dependent hydrolase
VTESAQPGLEIVDCRTCYGPDPQSERSTTLEDLRAAMAADGIAAALTHHTMAVCYDHREGNRRTLDELAGCAEFTPVAVLPWPACFGPEDVHAVAEAGFRVVRIIETVEWPLDNAALAGILAAAAEARLLVMLEAARRGKPSELGRALGDLELDVICLGLHYTALAEMMWVMRDHPRIVLDTSSMALAGQIEEMVDRVGAGRLVYGSGWPVGEMRPRRRVLETAEIDEATRAAIAAGNLRRLLEGTRR